MDLRRLYRNLPAGVTSEQVHLLIGERAVELERQAKRRREAAKVLEAELVHITGSAVHTIAFSSVASRRKRGSLRRISPPRAA